MRHMHVLPAPDPCTERRRSGHLHCRRLSTFKQWPNQQAWCLHQWPVTGASCSLRDPGLVRHCAGSIVRAPLGRIYLLTADHCFTDKTAISDFEFWLLLFNYKTECGSSDAPPLTQIVQVGGLPNLAVW